MTPSRVTFVTSTLHPRRGMEVALLRLAEQLAPAYAVTVVVLRSPGTADVPGVRVEAIGARRAWGGLLALRRRLLSVEPGEVVVLTGLWAAMRAVLVAPRATGRAAVWEHSLTQQRVRSGPRFRLKAELAALACRRARTVVAVSDAVAEALRSQWGIESIVVPNLLALPSEAPGRSHRPTSRSEGSERSGPARLLAVGAAKPVKHYDLLLRSLARVPEPWTLQMVGGGPLEPDLQRLARALGIADRVQWCGDVSDVATLMAQADLLVHPAASETFGYVLLEAAEQWLPVVAVAAPVMDRLVPDLVPGVLSELHERSFAVAVRTALGRPDDWDFPRADAARRSLFADERTVALWERVITGLSEEAGR